MATATLPFNETRTYEDIDGAGVRRFAVGFLERCVKDALLDSKRRSSVLEWLDAAVCWPRLWLLLPKEAKKDLTETRGGLDAGAVAWLWSVLFLVWTVLAWWAAAVGVVAAVLAHRWMIGAAETYGDLLESAFDVHRTRLYAALRWPLPANAAEEREAGRRLTEYLWRGSDRSGTTFTQPE